MTALTRLIIDTDLFSDVDDVGALAVAHALADLGEVDIAAICLNTPSAWGAAAVRAINRFYGRSGIPVGGLEEQDESEAERDFARRISMQFEELPQPAPPAVPLLRRVLADAPDGGVVIASIGFFDNLVRLLRSGADEASALDGPELVRRKVARTVVMGGRFPEGEEFNLASFPATAREFVRSWPVAVDFLGWEVGADVVTGAGFTEEAAAFNPVAAAYRAYTGGRGRASWDPMTVALAVRGPRGLYWYSEPGRVDVSSGGYSKFVPEEAGPHRYVKRVANAVTIARSVDALLVHAPRPEALDPEGEIV